MTLARYCLILSWSLIVLTLVAVLAALGKAFPHLLILLAVVGVFWWRRRSVVSSAYGSAAWSGHRELLGMLHATGLPLGTIPRLRHSQAFFHLLRCKDRTAGVHTFLRAADRLPTFLAAPDVVHAAIFAGAGRGKTTGFIVPMLQTCPDSMVVLDVKGELAKQTAEHRRKRFGQKIVILDSWGDSGGKDRWNPLDQLSADDPHTLDTARAIASAIVVRTGEEKERHRNDSAEMWIAGVVALLATMTGPDRNLQTVAQVIADPNARAEAVRQMLASPAFNKLLARQGYQLSNYSDNELSSVMTTTATNLAFLATPAVQASTTSSTFDPRVLRSGMTIYLCVPPHLLATQGALLRLWITSLLRVISQGGLSSKPVRFLLDECASLEHLPVLESALAQMRGYGFRATMVFQSMGQLDQCFPKCQAQTMLSNTDAQVYFGISDRPTAEYVSKSLVQDQVTGREGSRRVLP